MSLPIVGFCLDESKPPFICVSKFVLRHNPPGVWIKDIKEGEPYPIDSSGFCAPYIKGTIDAISKRNLEKATIGYEEYDMPELYLNRLREAFPNAKFVPAQHLFLKIRAVKTSEELRRIKEGYRIASAVYNDLFKNTKPGMTLRQVFMREWQIIQKMGAQFNFNHLWISGPDDPWGPGPDKVIRDGDNGGIDLGVIYQGYTTDFARIISFGPASDELRKNFEELMIVREVIAKEAVIGATGAFLKQIALDTMKKHNMEEIGCLGHGLGIEFHEIPFLNDYDTQPIEQNMVLVIEMARMMGENKFLLLEDAGVITENGWNKIADLPHDLVEII
jgi:Xaa-Pro aminopeptidase